MIYQEYLSCLSDKAKILLKEKNDKYLAYVPILNLLTMFQDKKKEYYTLDEHSHLHRVKGIEYVGMQEFFILETFSGSKLYLGQDTEILVDTQWIMAHQITYHERIYEYNFLNNHFQETYITMFEHYGAMKAYQVYSEKDTGMIVDNLIIRFDNTQPLDLHLFPKK